MKRWLSRIAPEWLRHWYAAMFGYFWIPCPLCRRMFAGFECAAVGLMDKAPREGGDGVFFSTSKLVCFDCADKATEVNRLRFDVWHVGGREWSIPLRLKDDVT